MSLASQNSSVSSASCTTLQDSVNFLLKSFMYRLKIRGPKIVMTAESCLKFVFF